MARSGSKRLFTAEMRLLNKLETMSDMVALPTDMPTDANGSVGGADISSLHTAIEELKKVGVGQLEILHTRSPAVADLAAFAAPLEDATGVWLSRWRRSQTG